MWLKLDKQYFYEFAVFPINYELHVTDFIIIYSITMPQPVFVDCLQKSNPSLEIDENDLVTHAVAMLKDPLKLEVANCKVDGGNLILSMLTNTVENYPLRLNLILKKATETVFFQKVTKQLLGAVADLRSSESQLCQLLTSKDKEIEEYKEEGGSLFLKYLKTPPFQEAAHLERHTAFESVFGSTKLDGVLERMQFKYDESAEIEQQMVNLEDRIKVEQVTSHDQETGLVLKKELIQKSQIKREPLDPCSAVVDVAGVKREVKRENKAIAGVIPKKLKKGWL